MRIQSCEWGCVFTSQLERLPVCRHVIESVAVDAECRIDSAQSVVITNEHHKQFVMMR